MKCPICEIDLTYSAHSEHGYFHSRNECPFSDRVISSYDIEFVKSKIKEKVTNSETFLLNTISTFVNELKPCMK